jgi:hypothetical protein
MDHHEQHHQKHMKEREHEKKEHKEHETGKSLLPFHPAWLVVAGTVLTVAAIVIWTLLT